MLDVERLGEPAGDRRVIGGGAGKGLGRQLLAEIAATALPMFISSAFEHRGIVGRVGDDGDIGVVLGRGADHRRAADVDVLDDRGIVGAGAADFLERVEIDDDEVDRLDAVLAHRRRMLGIVAHAEQPAMHRRMQRLDAAVHDLGKAGELGDVAHGDAGLGDRLGRAAGRDQLDAGRGKRPWRSRSRPVLSETESSARRTGTRSGAGMFLEATAMGWRPFTAGCGCGARRST